MKKVLFLCTGNTCRSCMAEALFKKKLKEAGLDIQVESAGLAALGEASASRNAIQVMADKGLDISSHTPRAASKEVLEGADLILTMTVNHKRAVMDIAPETQGRVFTLKEYIADKAAEADLEYRTLQLMDDIQRRRDAFFEKNSSELARLSKERDNLLKQLESVERQIYEMNKRLEDEMKNEKEELNKLQIQSGQLDISDPFGGPAEYYRQAADEIEEAVDRLILKIKDTIDKDMKAEGDV